MKTDEMIIVIVIIALVVLIVYQKCAGRTEGWMWKQEYQHQEQKPIAGTGYFEGEAPTPVPTQAPTPVPTPAPTPAPTPPKTVSKFVEMCPVGSCERQGSTCKLYEQGYLCRLPIFSIWNGTSILLPLQFKEQCKQPFTLGRILGGQQECKTVNTTIVNRFTYMYNPSSN